MTRPLVILALLLPLSAHAGDLRIVKCTQGLYAVQEYAAVIDWSDGWDTRKMIYDWRTLPDASGCYPMDAARQIRDDESAWRNRPPAPQVIEPVQVVE